MLVFMNKRLIIDEISPTCITLIYTKWSTSAYSQNTSRSCKRIEFRRIIAIWKNTDIYMYSSSSRIVIYPFTQLFIHLLYISIHILLIVIQVPSFYTAELKNAYVKLTTGTLYKFFHYETQLLITTETWELASVSE